MLANALKLYALVELVSNAQDPGNPSQERRPYKDPCELSAMTVMTIAMILSAMVLTLLPSKFVAF